MEVTLARGWGAGIEARRRGDGMEARRREDAGHGENTIEEPAAIMEAASGLPMTSPVRSRDANDGSGRHRRRASEKRQWRGEAHGRGANVWYSREEGDRGAKNKG